MNAANRRMQTRIVWSTEVPPAAPELVVLRIPKQRPLFEYQLSRLARLLPEQTTVLAAGMDKHLSPHTAAILEQLYWTYTASPRAPLKLVFLAQYEISGAHKSILGQRRITVKR